MFSFLLLALFSTCVFTQIFSLRPENSFSSTLVGHIHPQQPHHRPYQRYAPRAQPEADTFDDIDLLDIVLLASVDGKLHALNRTSGYILWSMGPYTPSTKSGSGPSYGPGALSPLVRTSHIEYDYEITDDSIPQEMYIIEPQSGDIYIIPRPSAPLQRFPFSMQELVDMSPFRLPGDEDGRVFVGKKETSLLVIELETGRIKATLNSECPWDQFEEFRKDELDELDLDELEGSKSRMLQTTDVYIGRTDYHVSIITRPHPDSSGIKSNSGARNFIQNLSFSTYGPNRQDNHLQSLYRRTKDNCYVQPLSSGEIMAFRADANPERQQTLENYDLLWGHDFSQPITSVATLDVLRKRSSGPSSLGGDSSSHPFILLQPQPKIQDLIPNLPNIIKENLRSAYVGLISETGSLFAMTPQNFPLVVFGRHDSENRLLDSPGYPGRVDSSNIKSGQGRVREEEEEEAATVDELTKRRKLREVTKFKEEVECHDQVMNDRRCLVGMRRVELDIGGGTETRMKRLLDAAPSALDYDQHRKAVTYQPLDRDFNGEGESSNESTNRSPLTIDPPSPPIGSTRSGTVGVRMWETIGATIIIGFIMFWVSRGEMWRKALGIEDSTSPPSSQEQIKELEEESVKHLAPGQGIDTRKISPVSTPTLFASTSAGAPKSALSTAVDYGTPIPGLTAARPSMGDETDKEDLITDAEEFIIVDTDLKGFAAVAPIMPKKRTRRGRRGARKHKNDVDAVDGDSGNGNTKGKEKESEEADTQIPPNSLIITSATQSSVSSGPSLTVSDVVLGYGSHGTVVFRGSLQGRAVAVKRLLADFVTLASREVSLLQESDDHPNVIRYYYQEAHAGFLYIALELCPASLADLIETPDRDAWRHIAVNFDPKRALQQVTNGLRHLHELKIVHRDIKPQNILVSTKGIVNKNTTGGRISRRNYRMLISDFGLCKKLDVDQTSFLPTTNGAMAAGTVGWRAPEILSGEVKLNEFVDDQSQSSRGSTATIQGNASISSTSSNNSNSTRSARLTKSVDIFALGCLYYYTLTGGGHPFGDRYEREVNIMKNAKNLELLQRFGEEGTEAIDLIEKMLNPLPPGRPDTTSCLLHPFFWDSSRRLNFLQDASDRFEIMCRDPKDPNLLVLEEGAVSIVGNNWHSRLDKVFIDNLGKFRKYDRGSVQDLLRALRNKKHHYQDIPENVKRHIGTMPEGYLAYFTRRFPNLFLHVHRVVKETGLADEPMFRSYFELPES